MSLCLKETSNRARGAHGLNMIEMVIFCSLTLSLALAVFFYGKLLHKTEKRKLAWMSPLFFVTNAEKCVNSMFVEDFLQTIYTF